jgi:hypothetical protein
MDNSFTLKGLQNLQSDLFEPDDFSNQIKNNSDRHKLFALFKSMGKYEQNFIERYKTLESVMSEIPYKIQFDIVLKSLMQSQKDIIETSDKAMGILKKQRLKK